MTEPKEGILPLVGRVVRQRMGEFKAEAKAELLEGLAELKQELVEELGESSPSASASEGEAKAPNEQTESS